MILLLQLDKTRVFITVSQWENWGSQTKWTIRDLTVVETGFLQIEPNSWVRSSSVLGGECSRILECHSGPHWLGKSSLYAQLISLWRAITDERKDGAFTHWPLEPPQPWWSSVKRKPGLLFRFHILCPLYHASQKSRGFFLWSHQGQMPRDRATHSLLPNLLSPGPVWVAGTGYKCVWLPG